MQRVHQVNTWLLLKSYVHGNYYTCLVKRYKNIWLHFLFISFLLNLRMSDEQKMRDVVASGQYGAFDGLVLQL